MLRRNKICSLDVERTIYEAESYTEDSAPAADQIQIGAAL